MPTFRAFFLIAVFVVLQSSHSLAWNAAGQKTVAEIAWQKLDRATRNAVVAILRRHPRFREDFDPTMHQEVRSGNESVEDHWIFCHAACWPDIARSQPKFHRESWHYIDLPVFATGAEAMKFGGRLPANVSFELNGSVDEMKYNAVQAVKQSLVALGTPTISDEERAVHYCWLLHIIPNVAEPLNSSALFTAEQFPGGDRGGNKIYVKLVGTPGRGEELHSVWNGLLGSDDTFCAIQDEAKSLIAANLHDFESSSIAIPWDIWTTEAQQLAATWAYEPLMDAMGNAEQKGHDLLTVEVPGSYFRDARKVARRQAVVSGVRLAGLLHQIVQADSPMPVIAHSDLGFPAVIADAPLHKFRQRTTVSRSNNEPNSEADAPAARIASLEEQVFRLQSMLPPSDDGASLKESEQVEPSPIVIKPSNGEGARPHVK